MLFRSKLRLVSQAIGGFGNDGVGDRRHDRAGVLYRHEDRIVQWTIGACWKIFAAVRIRADEMFFTAMGERGFRIHGYCAGSTIDLAHHVLEVGWTSPEEFAGTAIERVDDAGLAWNTGDDFAALAFFDFRIDLFFGLHPSYG